VAGRSGNWPRSWRANCSGSASEARRVSVGEVCFGQHVGNGEEGRFGLVTRHVGEALGELFGDLVADSLDQIVKFSPL
jgi:hypothetical protein